METKNKTKELLKKLHSTNNKTVLDAVELFRSEGNTTILAEFIDVVLSHNNDAVIQNGIQVLYDIKDEKAVDVIFSCIKDKKYAEVQTNLIAVLWESGMNCDDRLEDLVEMEANRLQFLTLYSMFMYVF